MVLLYNPNTKFLASVHNIKSIFDFTQKPRRGCGCPKFLAGKVFRQISTLLENYSQIFRQHEMLSLPRFGHFPATKMAAGKSGPPSGTLLDFLLRDRHSLLEFFWFTANQRYTYNYFHRSAIKPFRRRSPFIMLVKSDRNWKWLNNHI